MTVLRNKVLEKNASRSDILWRQTVIVQAKLSFERRIESQGQPPSPTSKSPPGEAGWGLMFTGTGRVGVLCIGHGESHTTRLLPPKNHSLRCKSRSDLTIPLLIPEK